MILTVRPATLSEAQQIAPRLREEDRKEVVAATGRSPQEIVPLSFTESRECYTVRLTSDDKIDPDPCVIFGVVEKDGHGIMWMLCTPEILKAPLSLLREARYWIDRWASRYPLHNIVWRENDTHVRWLQYLGFRLLDGVSLQDDFIYAYHPQCVNPPR